MRTVGTLSVASRPRPRQRWHTMWRSTDNAGGDRKTVTVRRHASGGLAVFGLANTASFGALPIRPSIEISLVTSLGMARCPARPFTPILLWAPRDRGQGVFGDGARRSVVISIRRLEDDPVAAWFIVRALEPAPNRGSRRQRGHLYTVPSVCRLRCSS